MATPLTMIENGQLTFTEKLGNKMSVERLDMFEGYDGEVYFAVGADGQPLAPMDLTMDQQRALILFLIDNVTSNSEVDQIEILDHQIDAILITRIEALATKTQNEGASHG
jgi:hypothetical protein